KGEQTRREPHEQHRPSWQQTHEFLDVYRRLSERRIDRKRSLCDTFPVVRRRDFVKIGGLGLVGAGAARLLPGQEPGKADVTLRIAPVVVELAPDRVISTVGYNGTSPGPLLRMKEGAPVTVDVVNDTDVPELVHWHGVLVPAEVDGAEEEGTPVVPPHGRRRYQ